MEFKEILYDKRDYIATVTMNRPERMNTFSETMLLEMVEAIQAAVKDDDVRVLIITGAGRMFCAGMDVKNKVATDTQEQREAREGLPLVCRRHDTDYLHKLPIAIRDCDKPVIAMVNGAAAGGGMDIASYCDVRIASENARFVSGFINMGIIPGDGGAYYLPRLIGVSKALELIWGGELFSAEEAERIGYVMKVVPHDRLEEETRAYATKLTKKAPLALQMGKRLVYRGLEMELKEALALATQSNLLLSQTEDAKEGPRAWAERREPTFKGR